MCDVQTRNTYSYLCVSPGCFRYVDPREGIHGALHLVAVDARDRIETLSHQFCLPAKSTENCSTLLTKSDHRYSRHNY